MSLGVIALIAGLTYATRAFALAVMPNPPARVRVVLDRVPAPLFAALAATSLVEDAKVAGAETLCAALFALGASWTRSLLWVLVAGIGGYALGALVFG